VKKNFTTANFDTLPRDEKLLFCHEIFGMIETISMLITCVTNIKAKRFTQERYSKSINICSCENVFSNLWDSIILWVKFHMDVRKSFSQRHMLVELEYLFLCKSFGLEIWQTFYQLRDGLMPKFS